MGGKMLKNNTQEVFAKVFGMGLFLLVLDAIKDYLYTLTHYDFLASNLIPLSAIGLIICLISIPFLMVEWLVSPLGTQSKRIQLYQGAGNLLALTLLVAGWLSRDHAVRQLPELASVSFTSGGLITAVIFGWTGRQIALFLSEKRIQFELKVAAKQQIETPQLISKTAKDMPKASAGSLIKSVSRAPLTQN